MLYQVKHYLDILGNIKSFIINDFMETALGMANQPYLTINLADARIWIYMNAIFQRWKQNCFKDTVELHGLYMTEAVGQPQPLHYREN